MSNGAWSDQENDLIVADYFAMLADDVYGRSYNKAEHRRGLLPLLNDRSEGSVEFKHQNISAVLKGLGEDWIPGYKPAFNFQMTLVGAVARWLALNPAWLDRHSGIRAPTGIADASGNSRSSLASVTQRAAMIGPYSGCRHQFLIFPTYQCQRLQSHGRGVAQSGFLRLTVRLPGPYLGT